jgi:predicted nucleic-acid-binding protein
MRAVDTNVLLRILTREDSRQAAAAEAFIGEGAWVSTLALAEVAWVLGAVYRQPPDQVIKAVTMLLEHRDLTLQDADAVADALNVFRQRPALGFSDCLILELARKAGHLPLGTFDRTLGRVDGTQKL